MAPRDEKIDALRLVAMALVVLGHAIVYTHLSSAAGPGQVAIGALWIDRATLESLPLNIAYSVHMPLFTFLSAYVVFGREGVPSGMIGRRAVGLLVPFVAWMLVGYGVGAATSGASVAGLARYVGERILYPQTSGAAWYLVALFGCFVAFAAVRALGERDVLLMASAVAVGAITFVPGLRDAVGVYDVAWLYPFFVMGYLFAKHAQALRSRRRALLWGGVVVWIAALPLVWPVLVPEVNWWYPVVRAALHSRGIPGAVALLYAARYLCAAGGIVALFFAFDAVRGRMLSWAAWAGRRSLGVYVVQTYLLLALTTFVTRDVAWLAILTFAGSLGATWLLERTAPTRLLFLGQRARRVGEPQAS